MADPESHCFYYIEHRKACDRWYVPDPNKAGDLESLREWALLEEDHKLLICYDQTVTKMGG